MFFRSCVIAASFVVGILSATPLAHGAALYIDPAFPELYRGDAVILNVRLDVDDEVGECINAIDAVLTYPPSLDPVDISLGDSIISLWPEAPTINRDTQTITFAGGIPNGYCGRVAGDPRLTNTLLKIVFRLPSFAVGAGAGTNTAIVAFSEETGVYLNDGRGTRIAPDLYPATLTLRNEVGSTLKNDWQDVVNADTIPPEEFSISLQRDVNAFSNRWFIVFNTTDKQTGVDQYQVMEEPMEQFAAFEWGRADAPWVTVTSPYILKDQSLNSVIRVKAIDKAGNEYIASYIPEESMRTLSSAMLITYVLAATIVLFLGVMATALVLYFRRRRRERAAQADTVEVPDTDEQIDDNEV